MPAKIPASRSSSTWAAIIKSITIESSDALTMPKIAPPNSAAVGSSSGFARTHDPPKNQSWHPLSIVAGMNEVKFAAEVGASDGA